MQRGFFYGEITMSKSKKIIEDDILITPNSGYLEKESKPTIIKESKRRTYKDYADYLKSPKWRQVKKDYKKNMPLDICFFCISENNLQHHHWNYDKDWNDDKWENLILVCNNCHTIIHEDILNPVTNCKLTYISYVFKAMHKRTMDARPVKQVFHDSSGDKLAVNRMVVIDELSEIIQDLRMQLESMTKVFTGGSK